MPRAGTSRSRAEAPLFRQLAAEPDDATLDDPDIRVRLAVLETDVRDAETVHRRFRDEEVRPAPEPRLERVLQEPMRDVDCRAEQLAVRPDRLAHDLSAVDDHLEIEFADDRARDADVVLLRDGVGPSCLEGSVDALQLVDEGVAVPVEGAHRGGREDRVSFELVDGEFGLDALHDRIEQGPEEFIAGRDAVAEIDAVRLLDANHEGRIPGDVSQKEVLLADRRTHSKMVRRREGTGRPAPAVSRACHGPRPAGSSPPCFCVRWWSAAARCRPRRLPLS
ncbi:MAG TPA: hypothetical protein VF119_01195 [Candidatus Limnocylindrales bacterium]